MARIRFPGTFAGIVKLFTDADAKHTAQPAPKTLQPYLDEQGIVMATDAAAVTDAAAASIDFGKAEKKAEELSEKRDNLFTPVFRDHEGCVQFLKKLFRGNPQKLGDWGVTVDVRGRVVYPPDFAGRQAAVLVFIAKHNSFAPPTSPLQPYLEENIISLVTNKTDADNALIAHNDFLAQDALRELKRELRDITIAPIEAHLRGEGQYLVGLFANTPKKAGEWGFEVDDSPQADRTRDGVVNFASSKTLQQLALGSVLTVTGPVPMNLFSGKAIKGVPVVMNPGDKFIIVRGFGTSTLQNEDPAKDSSYEATFNV